MVAFLARLLSLVLMMIGLTLLGGGAYLIWLGGSPYYAAAGILVVIASVQLWRLHYRPAVSIYWAMLAGTLIWALWEAGLNGWALMARLLAPFILGLALLPFLGCRRISTRRAGLAFTMLLAFGAGAGALIVHPSFSAPAISLPVNVAASADSLAAPAFDWTEWGGNKAGQRFSALDQITPANVNKLQVAWTYRIGMNDAGGVGVFEATPLKIGDKVFICGSGNDVVALSADTGQQLWRWDSHTDRQGAGHLACRGVAYYQVPDATGPCATRIYTATIDARLAALDAQTGQACADFGNSGIVDLTQGMGEVPKGYYFVTSAPAVVRGKIVLGGWVTDNQSTNEPSGVVRAFDGVTGQLAWAWDIGRPGVTTEPPPGQEFTRDTPNSWAPISADEKLGLVYVPTAASSPDYYGAQRSAASEAFSSSIVAIDADTGLARWHFQTAHHDVWDYDAASQPTLVDIPSASGALPALLAPTKRGELFLLNRVTGIPIAQVVEKPVPMDGVVGERLSPTQPFSVGMPSFTGPPLTEAAMWGATPLDQLWCRITFRSARYEGPMTPLGLQWTLLSPGYVGGVDWGSLSVDPTRSIAIVTSSRIANRDRLITRAEANARGYFPAKAGALPNFFGHPQAGTPYGAETSPFLSPLGIPCQQPPFGLISAVDLKTHKLLWSHPLGSARDSGPLGLRSGLPFLIGTPLVGGSITTASGLIFVAATQDAALRAFDSGSGALLWKAILPAAGNATPITYRSDRTGRQYVLIDAGGSIEVGSRRGDYVIAYALPQGTN